MLSFQNSNARFSPLQTSSPSLTSTTCSIPIQLRTVTLHSFFPSSKIYLILATTSFKWSSSGRETSYFISPALSNNSSWFSSILSKTYSSLLVIGASTISPEWKVHSYCFPVIMSLPLVMTLADPCFPGLAVLTSVTLHGKPFIMTKEPGLSLWDSTFSVFEAPASVFSNSSS